jgi:hypothetical protein
MFQREDQPRIEQIYQELTTIEVIKHIGKTEVIKHMSNLPRVASFSRCCADPAPPPPSHEAQPHV